jgi:ABC-2 type transport system permease protein
MTALVRAELLKLQTIRMTAWLFATCLCLAALDCLAIVATASPGTGPGQVHDPHLLALGVGGAGIGEVIMLVLGILIISQESRFGTQTASFLVTPRRGLLVVAKLVVVALAGALFAAASIALVIPLSAMLVSLKGGTLVWDRQVAEVPLAAVLVLMMYGLIGVALGALVRNQIAAIAGSLAWMIIVEQILIQLFPAIGRWTPGGATAGVLQLGSISTTRGDLLPVWAAGLLLAAYAGVMALFGARLTLRRDIT